MKKIIITFVIVIVAIVAGIFMINAYDTEGNVTEKPTKVGVVLNGYKDDKSWSQSHYEGIEKTAKQLNLDIYYKEFVTSDNVMGIIHELVEDGCEIIIANSAA